MLNYKKKSFKILPNSAGSRASPKGIMTEESQQDIDSIEHEKEDVGINRNVKPEAFTIASVSN